MSTAPPSLPIPGRARFAALGILGAVMMAVGWYGAAGTVMFDEQMGSSALAAAGAMAVCTAVVLRTLEGRRAVERRLADLVHRASELPSARTGDVRLAGDGLVATASMSHYHRPSCPMASGKPVQAASRTTHEAAGRRPCGVCLRGTPPDPRGQP